MLFRSSDLTQIETPKQPDRQQWLNELAHSEWTLKDLATGWPLQRLLFTIPGQTFV